MKKALLIGFMVVLNSLAYAAGGGEVDSVGEAKCKEQVLSIAKSALDLNAKNLDFTQTDILPESVKLVSKEKINANTNYEGTRSIYSLTGYIYKGEYDIRIEMDSDCFSSSITIRDTSLPKDVK